MRTEKIIVVALSFCLSLSLSAKEKFPDGTTISEWFKTTEQTDIGKLGKHYSITDYGVANDSTVLQTKRIQKVIDKAYENGGGVIVIPQGTYLSGSLFFKQGTHLHLAEGAVLKGSDDISHFKLHKTRIEGETVDYFAALVNADGIDGFTISGKGTLNGNGHRYWRAFWLRRKFNPNCTNKDEMRPRILYVSNGKNVQISGIRLINSPYWTSHYYKCENLKLLNLTFFAPHKRYKAPSSDAIDLDVCSNVLVKGCYMSVNDDAISFKGGKGPFADTAADNGSNLNIIIEDCEFGFCHSALTCGSESVHTRNVILRRTKVSNARTLFLLKMRPDTRQVYEYISIEDIEGYTGSIFNFSPWTQFVDLKGEKDIRTSTGKHISFDNINVKCDKLFKVKSSDQYKVSDVSMSHFTLKTSKEQNLNISFIDNLKLRDITINGKKVVK